MKQEQMQEAQRLYFQTEMSNTKIAETIGISRRTLLYWISENNWERLRESAAAMPSLITEKVYHIMDMLTDQILLPDRCGAPITREEVDNLHKLAVTIAKLKARSTLNENMEMLACFSDDVMNTDPALAEQLAPHIDRYINTRASVSSSRLREQRIDAAERTADTKWENAMDAKQDAGAMLEWAAQNAPVAPSPLERAGERSIPKEKFDIRKQLRGTSTKGPGKSFHKQTQNAA